ncbi:MAG: arsenite methyltransferase [Actinomycetota bacterium]
MSEIREQVRERYAQAAVQATTGRASCCDDSCGDDCNTACSTHLYSEADLAALPEEAKLASLGCGNPTAVAELRAGETVLDLGSGGGIDVLLSAKRVGPDGKVYGLDMTDEMLALAIANRDREGARNVEFLKGYIEEVPLPASTIDVVISNCVINLSADKSRVFAEMFRVLRPGGRIGVSDVVAEDHLSPADRAERGSYVGCIAGALSFGEYERGLRDAGFEDIILTPTHVVADGLHSAIIRATKPRDAREDAVRRELPMAAEHGCC